MERAWLCGVVAILASTGLTGPSEARQEYGYDTLGRLIRVAHPNGIISLYSYDAAGNRLQLARGAGGPPPPPAAAALDDYVSTSINSTAYAFPLFNDSGVGLTVISVSNVTGGNAYVAAGGADVIYHAPWFPGPQSFTYTIQDNLGRTASATVYIDVADFGGDPCNPSGDIPCEIDP